MATVAAAAEPPAGAGSPEASASSSLPNLWSASTEPTLREV